MFSLPSLPTDNLYKFVAISGLTLVAAGLIFPPLLTDRLHTEYTSKLDAKNQVLIDLQLKVVPPKDGKPNPRSRGWRT